MPTFKPPLYQEFFDQPQTFSATPGRNGWTTKKTGSGTPTVLNQSNRGVTLTLDSTNELQVITLYQNNQLPWLLSEIEWFQFIAKVSGIDAQTALAFGLCSAQNDTLDSTTINAWWRMQGSASTSNVVAETDDNTTNTDDVATGTTLAGTYKDFTIDFRGGLAAPRLWVNGARVSDGGGLTLAAAGSQGVQPLVQLLKASGTGVPSISIGAIRVKLRGYSL